MKQEVCVAQINDAANGKKTHLQAHVRIAPVVASRVSGRCESKHHAPNSVDAGCKHTQIAGKKGCDERVKACGSNYVGEEENNKHRFVSESHVHVKRFLTADLWVVRAKLHYERIAQHASGHALRREVQRKRDARLLHAQRKIKPIVHETPFIVKNTQKKKKWGESLRQAGARIELKGADTRSEKNHCR